MSPERAKELSEEWKDLHGRADSEEDSGNFADAEALRMEAANIEIDLAEAGFNVFEMVVKSA